MNNKTTDTNKAAAGKSDDKKSTTNKPGAVTKTDDKKVDDKKSTTGKDTGSSTTAATDYSKTSEVKPGADKDEAKTDDTKTGATADDKPGSDKDAAAAGVVNTEANTAGGDTGTEEGAGDSEEKKEPVKRTPLMIIKQGLDNYAKNMSPTTYQRPSAGLNYQLNLLHIFKTACGLKDPEEFKECWETINTVIAANGTGCFSSQYLCRHLNLWKGTSSSLKSYTNLVSLITLMADKKTRKENKSKINIERCLDPKLTDLTELMAKNIRTFYNFR